MSLPSNVLILVWKLRENHLPGDRDKNTCVQKEYVTVTCGVVQYWAPVGVSEVKKTTLPVCKSEPRLLTGGLLSLTVNDAHFPTDSSGRYLCLASTT